MLYTKLKSCTIQSHCLQQQTSNISSRSVVPITCCPVVITGLNSYGMQGMLLRQYIIPYVQFSPFFLRYCVHHQEQENLFYFIFLFKVFQIFYKLHVAIALINYFGFNLRLIFWHLFILLTMICFVFQSNCHWKIYMVKLFLRHYKYRYSIAKVFNVYKSIRV